jgi:lipopolysaccharide export system permease protein
VIGFQRIDRYLAAELFRGYAVVAAILLALFSLFALLEELDDVGAGAYGVLDALAVVGMTTPARMLRLLPFVTLFGSTLALWNLARREELVVLRAAGMGLPRLALATTLPSLVLVIATPVLFEFVAPSLYRDATVLRDAALGRPDDLAAEGFWSRRGDTLVEVGRLEHGRVARDVRIYQLAPGAGLDEILVADSADPDENGNWRLAGAERRSFAVDGIVSAAADGERWRPWWIDERHLIVPPVDSLSFSDLRGYIAYLGDTEQPTARWELVYWRMWWLPVAALLTGLLAIPIALTGSRQTDQGRVGLAVAIGLVYYPADQILANAGMISGVAPGIIAAAGPALLALVVLFMLRRVT